MLKNRESKFIYNKGKDFIWNMNAFLALLFGVHKNEEKQKNLWKGSSSQSFIFLVVLLLCKLPLLMKAIHSFSLFPFSLGLESWTSTENSWLFCFDLCFLHNHNQGVSHFDRLYSWTDHVSYLQEWVMHGICLQTHLVLPMQSSWDPETFPQMIGHQCGSWRQMSWHMSPCVPVRCMTSGTPSLASPLT